MALEKTPTIPTVKVIVARDYWDANETRVPAGTEIEVSIDDALDGIESGALTRVAKAK